jgi:transcriptional regulator with XRE-family HTH domain
MSRTCRIDSGSARHGEEEFDQLAGDAEALARANLRALLSEMGIKRSELARRLGLPDQSTVGHWLAGRAALTLPRLTEIANVLGVHVGVFLAEAGVEVEAPKRQSEDPDLAAVKRFSEATGLDVVEGPSGELRIRRRRGRQRPT